MKTPSFHLLRACLLAVVFCGALPGVAHADLIGYWSLDGDADADAGGWGASTVQSGANGENDISYPADVPAAISSRVSQSLAFDANNDDRIVTGFNAGTAGLSGTPALTVSFWIKQTVNTLNGRTLVYLGDGSTDKRAAFIMERKDDNLRVDFFNGIHPPAGPSQPNQFGFQTSRGARFVDDQWLHVGVTYLRVGSLSFPQVYIDGVELSGETDQAYRLLNLAEDAILTLGDSVSGDDAAAGFQLAELALWDEVLPEHRIKSLSNGYTPLDIFIRDCDKDGIDDREQLIETRRFHIPDTNGDIEDINFDATDGTPEVDGVSLVSPAPPALGDVTILLDNGLGDWVNQSDPNEYLLIYVNGTFIGRAYEQENQNTLVVPMATWNTLRNQPNWLLESPEDYIGGADGRVEIIVELSGSVDYDSSSSGVYSDGGLSVIYEMDRDMNDNGWLDDCVPDGDPSGPDTDGDGVSDQIDRSPNTIADPSLVDVYGQLLRVARFDADEDGDVDVNDLDLLDAAARDVDNDGDADLHDLASILQGARGPGVAADPAFLQQLQLYKAHTLGPEDLDIKPWYKTVPVEYAWYYDSTDQRWKISPEALYQTLIGYDNVNERSRLMYGTHLATVDKTGASPLTQWQQIDQIHDLTAASGSPASWIGMRWQPSESFLMWENGQFFDVNQGSQSAWVDSREIPGSGVFTAGQDDYYVFTIDMGGNGLGVDYRWINGDRVTPRLKEVIVQGFVAQLPDNTVPAAPVTTTETVTVTLDSSFNGQAVAPGETVDWTISFEVSSGDNSGLALLVTDLAQDAGNPASFELSAGTAPAAMQNFAAPLGFTGPGGFGGQQTGTAGALDLAQIGGAQNTLGGASSDTSQGQGTTVVSSIGQSGSTVLASGSFTAPATVGTYAFNLANTLATVLKSVGGAGEGSETVPANLTLAQNSITIEVSNPPVITLLGDNPVTHEAATPYTDAGATASDVEDGDLTGSIVVSNPVNVTVPDTYTVTYTATDSDGESSTATRTVHVVDTTAPTITLTGDASVTHEAGTPYNDAGVTAGDTVDGDLAGSLVVTNPVDSGTLGTYTVTYEVADAAGNTATPVQRTVEVVDTTPPVINLLGVNPVNMIAGDTFTDPGFTALDSFEGDLSASVTVSGTVNTLVHGNNILTYNVTDGSGNAATPVTRAVFVDGPEPPEFAEATVAVSVEETTTGVIHRAAADDPDGGVRFDHPGYVALFLTDEGTGAGATDALGSGLGLSFNAARWAVDANAPGGKNVLNTEPQILPGDRSWFKVDNFDVTNGLTVSEWIRFDDIQTTIYDPVIWNFGDMRVVDYNGRLFATGTSSMGVASPFVNGEWAHLIFSIDPAGNARLYLNGEEILSGQLTFDNTLTGNIFGHDLATLADGNEGARSDLSIIDGVLSETQAGMLYQSALRGHLGDVLRYSLGSAGDEGFFSLDAYTGELRLTGPLTHEDAADADGDNVYLVEVIATDSTGLSSSQTVEVTLNNTNVAPVITGTPVDPIQEVHGYYVYDFTVADADSLPSDLEFQFTDNRFTVSEDGAGGYRVHRKSSHKFDYETLQDYDFDLVVSDGVEEDRVNIAFSLVNINDNAPAVAFTSAGPITENDPGAVLGTVDVTDADGDTTFYFDYAPSLFEFAPDGRTLKLKDGIALDYETETSLHVGIGVADGPFSDAGSNWGFIDATIAVINVNDVAPSNIQLTGQQLSENDPGAVVGTLSADDADGPDLSFSVSDARFEVDDDTLKLKDGVALDREATPSVTLTVTGSDGTFDDTQDFTVTVLNVDEGAPQNLALSNAIIAENSTGVIGEISATDVDGDAITFSVTDSRFAVSGSTLELTTAINHESLAEGTVALEVTASGGGASTIETFLISIEDVNEAPTLLLMAGTVPLTGSNYPLTVLENTRQATLANSGAPGETQYPLSFQASDVDDDPLTWVLTGADAAAFAVDPVTGALNFVTPADFENPSDAYGDGVYQVTVSVTDGELASNTTTLALTILNTVDEPYDTWVADRGLTPGVNAAPGDDPDGDGCPNWKEFAFDGNPLSGTKSGQQRLGLVMVEGVEHLALTIPVRSGAVFAGTPSPSATVDGITYTIQGSSDLEDWTLPVTEVIPADSASLSALNNGWEYRTFVVHAGPQSVFLRSGLSQSK